MTIERRIAVAASIDDERRTLLQDIRSAASRARKADPGDRLDIVRYEALSSQLESWVYGRVAAGKAVVIDVPAGVAEIDAVQVGPSPVPVWVPEASRADVSDVLAREGVVLSLRLPLESGTTPRASSNKPPPPPADVFDAGGARHREAVELRFKDQLRKAVEAKGEAKPINPTGIQNVVLTETLRTFVGQAGKRVDVPVEYRDGSRAAHPFPLRSLKLHDNIVGEHDLRLRFALLSIRHTEMDTVVDGAWLRNIQISQPRPAAQTDDLVYSISRDQFEALTAGGRRVEIEMYQTGLEMAVVGFYRALVDHLIEWPASVSVRPMYHEKPRAPRQDSRSKNGKKGARAPNNVGVEVTSAPYRPGKVWAMRPQERR
jgi:hypothetical protein